MNDSGGHDSKRDGQQAGSQGKTVMGQGVDALLSPQQPVLETASPRGNGQTTPAFPKAMGDGKPTLAMDDAAGDDRTRAGLGPNPDAANGGDATPRNLDTKKSSEHTAETEPQFPPGTMVHKYEIIRELGRGGMGRVLLARDTMLGRLVAIKFLLSNSEMFNKRFLIEARTTAQVSHENIVIIHEASEFEGCPYMVLEYLEGQSLGHYLGGKAKPPGRVVELLIPVMRALVRAHAAGIVHRDLKPENIFLPRNGQVKVLDFGIAKLFERDITADEPEFHNRGEADLETMRAQALTSEGGIVGTMDYMSPEQWGHGPIDHRTDLWAVGILLYEMLAACHPFEARNPRALYFLTSDFDEPVPSILEHVSNLPADLASIVDRCLQKRVDDRIQTAEEVLDALLALQPGFVGRSLAEGENPFPGLVAFQEQDADRFFGRSRDIQRVIKELRERPMVAVVGPSGVGKSSMVRAGVVPAMKASGEDLETFILRPGRDPIGAIVNMLMPLTRSSGSTVDETLLAQEEMARRIREQPGYVGVALRNRALDKERQILVFVDQFEELYTLVPDAAERHAFVTALMAIADDATSPLRVIVSMRSDFLNRAGENEHFLDELSQGLVFLQPPDRAGIFEALTKPVEMAGFSYEDDSIVDDMLDSLETTEGALPLLQFTAAKLWDARDKGRRQLTRVSYAAMGGVAGTLASHANEVLAGLTSAQQKLVRAIFQRLVTSEGTRAIADIAELRELGGGNTETDKLIGTLVQSRLLVVQKRNDSDEAGVEIVHESLISKWPTLRYWLEESVEEAAFVEQLRTASKQWHAKGRPVGLLWRDEAMEDAKRFLDRFTGKLTSGEVDYLDAVMELGSRARRSKRYAVIGSLGLLSVLLVVAAAVALKMYGLRAEAQREANAAAEAQKVAEDKTAEARQALKDAKAAQDETALANGEKAKKSEELVAAKETTALTQAELEAKQVELEAKDAALQVKDKKLKQQEAKLEKVEGDLGQKEGELKTKAKQLEEAKADSRSAGEQGQRTRETPKKVRAEVVATRT